MRLDAFDQRVLEMSGDASDIMLELYEDKIGKNNAGKQLAGIRKHLNYKANLPDDDDVDISDLHETVTKADGSVTTKRMLLLSEEDSKDPIKIMTQMGFDPLQWKLEWCKTRRNYWDVSMKLGGEGTYYPEKVTNHAYVCEIRVSPVQSELTLDMVRSAYDAMPAPGIIKYYHRQSSGNLLELPIMDLHLGKLAWAEECGDDYDLKIAEKLYKDTITEMLQRTKDYHIDIDEILFPIGQDFFHFDTTQGTTTRGTYMDTDTRWAKLYQKGVELAVWAVDNLRKIAPVKVPYVAANHDKIMSYCLTLHLGAYFKQDENVQVCVSSYPRQYYRWGKCLIGYSHGSEEGKRIEKLMQDESPDWSETVFREFHLGHLHSTQVREDVGLIIRNIASITSRDNWHTTKGYRATRKAQGFIWNREKGKQLTIDVNITV